MDDVPRIDEVEVAKAPSGDRDRYDRVKSFIGRYADVANVEVVSTDRVETGRSDQYRAGAGYANELEAFTDAGLAVPETVEVTNGQQVLACDSPVIVKRIGAHRGQFNFLLQDAEARNKFATWFEENAANLPHPICGKARWVLQPYVNASFADRPVSARLFVDCTGTILASGILYGPRASDGYVISRATCGIDPYTLYNDPACDLVKPELPHFLNAPVVQSNFMFVPSNEWHEGRDPKTGEGTYDHKTGRSYVKKKMVGGGFVLDTRTKHSHPMTDSDKEVAVSLVEANVLSPVEGRDDDDVYTLPPSILEACQKIGLAVTRVAGLPNRIRSLYVGIDLVFDQDGHPFGLEANHRPALGVLRDQMQDMERVSSLSAEEFAIRSAFRHIVRHNGGGVS